MTEDDARLYSRIFYDDEEGYERVGKRGQAEGSGVQKQTKNVELIKEQPQETPKVTDDAVNCKMLL